MKRTKNDFASLAQAAADKRVWLAGHVDGLPILDGDDTMAGFVKEVSGGDAMAEPA